MKGPWVETTKVRTTALSVRQITGLDECAGILPYGPISIFRLLDEFKKTSDNNIWQQWNSWKRHHVPVFLLQESLQ